VVNTARGIFSMLTPPFCKCTSLKVSMKGIIVHNDHKYENGDRIRTGINTRITKDLKER
jgi:hypothetical protein